MKTTVLLAILTLVGCGSSPTAPTPQPPNIQGQWAGSYQVTSCTPTGAAVGTIFCPTISAGGGMVLTPQQTGTAVSGTLAIGGFSIPVTGTVGSDQVVVLAGSGPIPLGATATLQTWRGVVSGLSLTGTVQFLISTDNPIGTATIVGTFTLTR